MATVYIVTSGEYSSYQIVQVCSTEERASQYVLLRSRNDPYVRYQAEAFEVDGDRIDATPYWTAEVSILGGDAPPEVEVVERALFTLTEKQREDELAWQHHLAALLPATGHRPVLRVLSSAEQTDFAIIGAGRDPALLKKAVQDAIAQVLAGYAEIT